MPYPARQIADWFIARAASEGKSLTQMKLQKLVYIAHGWHLAIYDEPLIVEQVEAWKWGPVIRSLYRDFADFGSSAISGNPAPVILDSRTADLLEQVWKIYRDFSAVQLSAMTHADATPWKLTYRPERTATIPDDLILRHYRELSAARP